MPIHRPPGTPSNDTHDTVFAFQQVAPSLIFSTWREKQCIA